jgi:[histone H3]-lysine79 N-trimethyltransferase
MFSSFIVSFHSSGVGNCLVQASLATGCTSYGFENMESYSDIAEELISECKARWKLWGLNGGKVEAIRCDFTKGSRVSEILRNADVVVSSNL